MSGLVLEKHPDKTIICKAPCGFALFEYFLTPWGISVSRDTWNNMKKRIARLYKQGVDTVSIGQYVFRWLRWVCAGLKKVHEKIGMNCSR